jgi:hypothetical protein
MLIDYTNIQIFLFQIINSSVFKILILDKISFCFVKHNVCLNKYIKSLLLLQTINLALTYITNKKKLFLIFNIFYNRK